MVKNHAGYSCEKLVWINLKRALLRGFTILLPLSQTLDPFDSCELVNLAKFHPPVLPLLIVLPPRNLFFSENWENYHRRNIGGFWIKMGHFGPKTEFCWHVLVVINYYGSIILRRPRVGDPIFIIPSNNISRLLLLREIRITRKVRNKEKSTRKIRFDAFLAKNDEFRTENLGKPPENLENLNLDTEFWH